MITCRLTAIVAFMFLLSVASNASAALCTGDSIINPRQLFFVPVGGQIGINYTVDLNHTPNHPTCFGSMNAFAFSVLHRFEYSPWGCRKRARSRADRMGRAVAHFSFKSSIASSRMPRARLSTALMVVFKDSTTPKRTGCSQDAAMPS